MSAEPHISQPKRRTLVALAAGLYATGLAFLLWRLPVVGNPTSLDGAWSGLLQHDWVHDVRAGVGSVFTYGPTGFLLASDHLYGAEAAFTRYYASIATALIVAVLLTLIVARLPSRSWRLAGGSTALLLAPFSFSDLYLAVTALAVLCIRELGSAGNGGPGARPIPGRTWALVLATLLASALTGMAKFTYFVHGIVQVALFGLVLLLRRRWSAAAAIPTLFAVVFAIEWLAIGQSLGDIPAWLRSSTEIAAGYNEVMSQSGERWELLAGAGVFAIDLTVLVALLWPPNDAVTPWLRRWLAVDLSRAGAAAILASALFMTWKAGFVRHDSSHALLFFGFAALAPFFGITSAAAAAPPRRTGALALLAAMCALAVQIVIYMGLEGSMRALRNTFVHTVANGSPGRFRDYLDSALARNATSVPLSQLRAKVGDSPVDMMGHEQGLLFAGGFRVEHRPVFQSYSAYTPYLQELNAAFFRRADAPCFTLARVQAGADRLPLADDAAAWRVLLDDYVPTAVEHGVLLLERNQTAARSRTRRSRVVDRDAELGDWVEMPDDHGDWHELGADVRFSAIGAAIGVLYHPGALLLDLRTTDESTCRISPLLVRGGFLVDPLIRSERDLLTSWLDPQPRPANRVRAIRIRAAPGKESHFLRRWHVRIDACSPPTGAASAPARGLLESLLFPGFALCPFRVEPANNCSPAGDSADEGVVAHAPCELFFHWPGGRHRLSADFQLPEASYTNGNATDGVLFRIEVGTARHAVFEQLLQPKDVPADRGWHELAVDIDEPDGTLVVLATQPGPKQDLRWDWARWRRVRLAAH